MRRQKQFRDVSVKLEWQDFILRNSLFNFVFGESAREGDEKIILYPAIRDGGMHSCVIANHSLFSHV